MAIHESRLRTKLGGGAQWHRRVHPEFTRFIRRCRDYAAFVLLPAYYNRLSFEGRVEQFFYRHEERVHVDVENGLCKGCRRVHENARNSFAILSTLRRWE